MKIGDRYSSPWGEYVVFGLEPLVLRQGVGCVVAPSRELLAMLELVGSGTLPVTLDPRNETGTGPRPHASAEGGGSPSENHAEIVAEPDGDALSVVASGSRRPAAPASLPIIGEGIAPSTSTACAADVGVGGSTPPDHTAYAHELTLGAYRSTMSMAWVPGCEALVWVPCAGRSKIPEHAGKTHVYFLSTIDGSIYCPECRALRPRLLFYRDGKLVRDSHHDVVPAAALLRVRVSAAAVTADEESSSSELSSLGEQSSPLCAQGTDEESSSSELLAAPAARESTSAEVPPTSSVCAPVDDAQVTPSPMESPPALFPSDDPKTSAGSFDRVVHPTPIGRSWRGLWEWKEWCAERAAIIEYDANTPRKLAEQLARDLAGRAPRAA